MGEQGKPRIVVPGLYSISNFGDTALIECCKQQVLKEIPDAKFIDLDVHTENERFGGYYHKIFLGIQKFNPFKKHPNSKAYYCFAKFCRQAIDYRYYKNKIKNADMIIFPGGGFIKYYTQGLNYCVELILKFANKYAIPVMFNGCGVEGYADDDYRCQKLKAAINSSVVKTITVRDELATLNEQYITNKNIATALVADVALYLNELYPKGDTARGSVGINLINPGNFQTYGESFTKEDVFNLYTGIISKLEKQGIEWYLFSNGMRVDIKFGEMLIEQNGYSRQRLLDKPDNLEGYVQLLTSFSFVVAARLHSAIIALAYDIPFCGISWARKIKEFAKSTNMRDRFLQSDELNAANIVAKIKECEPLGHNEEIEHLKGNTKKYLSEFLKSYVK